MNQIRVMSCWQGSVEKSTEWKSAHSSQLVGLGCYAPAFGTREKNRVPSDDAPAFRGKGKKRKWQERTSAERRCSGFRGKGKRQVRGDDAPALDEKGKKREIASPSSGQISPCKG